MYLTPVGHKAGVARLGHFGDFLPGSQNLDAEFKLLADRPTRKIDWPCTKKAAI